jgi:hypothetical protein
VALGSGNPMCYQPPLKQGQQKLIWNVCCEVLTVVVMKFLLFCDMTSCWMIDTSI